MDPSKRASNKDVKGEALAEGHFGTPKPVDHSQQSPPDTKTASNPNTSQPSPAAVAQPTPSSGHDNPNPTAVELSELAKNKAAVANGTSASSSNSHSSPQPSSAPAKDASRSGDPKLKHAAGDNAKTKALQGPSGIPELERIEQKYLGLRQLYAPPETEDVEADIVFVHGIAAHPYKTWTHKATKINWLDDKSMLPADLPTARILYFGYQSAWFGQNAVRQTVNTAADQLLNSLMGRLRENCPERPIIFVAHCFGGLIIQRAFHIAHSHRSNFPGLIDAITGLIFLGTPHSGVEGNSALSTQGDIYRAIVAAQVKTHFETLEVMTHNNQMLHGIVQDFNTVLKNEVKVKPHIHSFFEMYDSNVGKIGGLGNVPEQFVVTESSATLYGYPSSGLNANHFNMNTFEDNQDASYDQVRQQIVKMAKLAREKLEQRKEEDTKSRGSRSHLPHLPKLPIPIRKDGHFADRGDILGLIDRKFHDENGAIVALTGGLGAGKTHIAVEYAYRYCVDNPGAHIHWIDASTAEQFEFSYKRIAESLPIRLRDPTSPQETVRDIYQGLKKGANSHWLMVVDGLDDEASLDWNKDSDTHEERSLWDFIPRGRHSTVLVTTRKERLARRLVDRKYQFVIEVNPLRDEDAAFMILGRHTTDKQKYEQTRGLAKRLGGTAGALTFPHAFHTKVDRKMEWKAYEEMLKLQELSKSDPTANTVLAWKPLHRALKNKHEEAANLLYSVGVLGVQSIPKDFFQKADWKLTRTLEAYGMIERSADDRFIRVTGIIRHCLQRYLEEKKKRESVEEKVLEQLCETLKGGGPQDLDEALLPSIHAALNFDTKSPEAKELAATLHLKVAEYYHHIGRFRLAAHHFEKCLAPSQKDYRRPYYIRDEDARSARKALEAIRAAPGDSKTRAPDLVKSGEYPGSRVVFVPNPQEIHTEIQRLERTSGRDHASTIQKVAELAALRLTHPSMRKGAKSRNNSLADTRGLPAPPNRPDSPKSPVAITPAKNDRAPNNALPTADPPPAELQDDKDEEDDAAALFQRLLATAVDSCGPKSMHTANAHFSLAIAHESQGNFLQSEKHFQQAIEISRSQLGVNSPECLRMLRALACLYARQGNNYIQPAQQIFTFVLRKQTEVLTETHPETLITRHNVALFLEEAGEWEAAGRELEKILGLQAYLLGRDQQETLQTACSLAMNYAARGRGKEAEGLFRATLVTQEQVLGATHVDTVATAERLREFLEEENNDKKKEDKGGKKEKKEKKEKK